jgi:excisionase family DNA binding protein
MAQDLENCMDKELCVVSDIAAICEVDIKTVHNWCEKRGMPHLRTPGRHIRFKLAEVVPWLAKYGYTIPDKWKEYMPKATAAAS